LYQAGDESATIELRSKFEILLRKEMCDTAAMEGIDDTMDL
jgi:hypothetical protein